MSHKEDLEGSIRESYGFIRDYEEAIRLASDPVERQAARRKIDKQWDLIEGYLKEYRPFRAGMPTDIAEIATHFGIEQPQSSPPSSPAAESPKSGSASGASPKSNEPAQAMALEGVGVDFVIVTALEEERDAVLDKLPKYKKLMPSDTDIRVYFEADLPASFPDGSTGAYRVVVMSLLGMGRVQAATATADAIRRWQPRYILMVGIAGGVAARGVGWGDVLVSDQIVDYELQKLTPAGPEVRWEVHRADPRLLGAAQNLDKSWQKLVKETRPVKGEPKRHIGPIASGDKVVAFGEVLDKYRAVWPKLVGVEMEAGGVAAAAFQAANPPGFFMVRGVSDLADKDKDDRWRAYACDVAATYTIGLLKSGPVVPSNKILVPGTAKPKEKPVSMNEQQLRQIAEQSFDLGSLDIFCWDYLGVNIQNITGSNLQEKIFHLFRWAEREGQTSKLIDALKRRFPAKFA